MSQLNIPTIYQNNLDLKRFSLILDNNSECYKFYWLEALVYLLVRDGKKHISFYEAAEEMIIQAWYTVSEFHLHMGNLYGGESKNGIERAINYLQKKTGLDSKASRDSIHAVYKQYLTDRTFLTIYKQITDDVPYRLLSPFVPELSGSDRIWHSDKRIIEYYDLVNSKTCLPYTMVYKSSREKIVIWNDQWAEMVNDNYLLILEWIRSKKIKYLQDRNPGVPGIVYKLDPEGVRKLDKVHKLWDAVMEQNEVRDIYSNTVLNGNRYDIDHFIPWSYVTTDELWNLIPAEKEVNISKSNNLPDWNTYFDSFIQNQLMLCDSINESEKIHGLFDKCRNYNLNTLWALSLYDSNNHDEFIKLLSENMRPIYYAAKLQGYSSWILERRL